MDFDRLDHLAKQTMAYRKSHMEREIGAAYFHGRRVGFGAVELRKRVTTDASMDDVLRVAGMFHDIGKGIEPHAQSGACLCRELLHDEITAEERDAVCSLIAAHAYRHPGTEQCTLWERLLQDADLLDHYGTQGLWLSCMYYAYHDQEEMGQVPVFYEKDWAEQIVQHRALLNFPAAQAIFDEKCAFERAVVDRMRLEDNGLYCG